MAWISREWFDESGKRKTEKTTERMAGTKEDDRFIVEWFDPLSGSRRRKKIKTPGRPGKREAIELMRKLDAGISPEQSEAKERKSWPEFVAEFESSYIATRNRSDTKDQLRRTIEYLEAFRRPLSPADIDARYIAAFIAHRLKKSAPPTVNKYLRNVRTILNRACEWEFIQRTPVIHFLPEDETDKERYTFEEVQSIWTHCDAADKPHWMPTQPDQPSTVEYRRQWWRTIVALLWETGGRRGDIIKAKWSNINGRTISVIGSGEKSRRVKLLHFGDWSEFELSQLAEFGQAEEILPFPHNVRSLNDELGRIQEAAGIDSTRENLKFHAFRRTVGDATTEAHGLATAQHKLNHTSAAITAKHYAKIAVKKAVANATPEPPPAIAAHIASKKVRKNGGSENQDASEGVYCDLLGFIVIPENRGET